MRIAVFFLIFGFALTLFGQTNDSLGVQPENQIPVMVKLKSESHSPKRATIMSAIIPGLGQVYNDKYWKVGVLYAGIGALAISYKVNSDSLKAYQRAYLARLDSDSTNDNLYYAHLQNSSIKNNRDFHRRMRDITILGFVAIYALNIIDANVDAHLKEFDINDDLSLAIEPKIASPFLTQRGQQFGLSLKLTF